MNAINEQRHPLKGWGLPLALTLLDDPHGISEDAYRLLSCMDGFDEIRPHVDAIGGRYFIAGDEAEELRADLRARGLYPYPY